MPDPAVADAGTEIVTPIPEKATPLADVNSIAEYRDRRSKGEGDGAPPLPNAPPAEPKAEPDAKPDADAASKAGKELAAKRGSLQARIDELTREKHQTASEAATARADAAALKAELAALKAAKPADEKPAPAAAVTIDPTDLEPDPAKFDDWTAYTKALARWEARQELKAERQKAETEGRTRAVTEGQARVREQGAKAHADFHDKVEAFEAAGGRYSPVAQDVILNHEMGAEFAYAFVSDPQIAARINGATNPYAAMLEAGIVLAEIKAAQKAAAQPAPKPKPVTRAPAPVEPVSGEHVASTPDPESMNSVREWRKYRSKFEAA